MHPFDLPASATLSSPLTLLSHALCPYVQRAAIVLAEKGVAFERQDIDLACKPDWFLQLSPLGKTPVLLVAGQPVFESAVICEYLDEVHLPRLHPQDALQRAQHRAWMEFGSTILAAIAGFYTAADEAVLQAKAGVIAAQFAQVERALGAGPYFSGSNFTLVDAVFGPVFRYFNVFERIDDFGFFTDLHRVQAWRHQLAARASVQQAVRADYPELLQAFLLKRPGALSTRLRARG
jgi:glutathione S-transferase